MSLVTHSVTHDVDLSVARRATRLAFEEYQRKLAAYSPKISWADENHVKVGFNIRGVSIHGAVELHDHQIDLEMDIPLLLRPFQKRAMTVLDGEIRAWLARVHAGEV